MEKYIHSVSLQGLRTQNEDNHVIIKNLDNKDLSIKDIDLFAIFDGHGGKQVSNYLKENLPKYLVDKRVDYPISKKYVFNLYDFIQQSIIKYNFSARCGSTGLIVVHFKKNNESYLNIINNGDCRCILCRDNFAMPLTKDHKPNWPDEKHRIEALGGQIIFDGYDWRIKDLSVSRSFGDSDSVPFLTHRPELFRYKLDKNDKFIVLACDGLWDVLQNFEVVNFILLNCYDNTTKNRINKDVNIAKKLGEYALEKGSTDNLTIIVVFLN